MAHSGTFIGLEVPIDVGQRIALPGGEKPEKLHVTLFYKKGLTTQQIQLLFTTFVDMFDGQALMAKLGGIGRFSASESSDGKDVIYLSVDSPDLQDFRDAFVEKIKKLGIEPDKTHGFTPHVTLAYVDAQTKTPFTRIKQPIEFVFTNASCVPGEPSDSGAPVLKKIDHFDDLKQHDFKRLCDLLKRGGVEMSEKLDGSARLEFGVNEGKIWTRSKHGTVKTESSQYPNKPMYKALRAAHVALESRAREIAESWPKGVGYMVAEVLHTPVPNSIQYGPNALVVHGVHLRGGQQVGSRVAQMLAQPMMKRVGTLGGGEEVWKLDYRPSIDPKTFSDPEIWSDIPDVYESRAVVRERLVKKLREQKSAYGQEMEGIVISDPASNLTVKLVDKDYFTKLNQFLWSYRERLDKGRKEGDEWTPGVLQSFRNSVADRVLGAPLAKTPSFVPKLKNFGKDLKYPKQAGTPQKKVDYLLAQWLKQNSRAHPDYTKEFQRSVHEARAKLQHIQQEWRKAKTGSLVAEIAGRRVEMHEIVKQRTDEAMQEMEERITELEEACKRISELKSPLTRKVAMLKLSLGERVQKIEPTPDELRESIVKKIVNEMILFETPADTVGVTIGRFQPPHKGHTEIVRKLAKQFTKTIVLVAGNKQDQKNPFSFDLRMQLMDLALGDVLNKIEFHKAEFQGKPNGFVPGILSDIIKKGGSSIKQGVAINVLVGPDRVEEIKQQFQKAIENKERYGLVFDPGLAVVNVLEGVKNDDDTDRISGTKVRQALIEGNKELVKKMLDPLVQSNEAEFEELYVKMRQELKQFFPQQIKEAILKEFESSIDAVTKERNRFTNGFDEMLQQNKERLLKKGINVDSLRVIGSGQDGTAYDMGGGKVLKMTVDMKEAVACNSLVNKNFQHIARMHDVFKFQTQHPEHAKNVYGIVEEKLEELQGNEKNEFNTFGIRYLPPQGPAGEEAKALLKTGDVKGFVFAIQNFLLKKNQIGTGQDDDPDATKPRGAPGTGGDPGQRTQQLANEEYKKFIALFKKYQLPAIMQDLKSARIEFVDYHGGNLMRRGEDYVLMDLGRSKSAGQEPGMLETIVRRVMNEIAAENRGKGPVKSGGSKRAR